MKVWVLQINHRHGEDVWVAERKETADEILEQYVADWWPYEFPEHEKLPERPQDAVEAYFGMMGEHGDEWYDLKQVEVL